MGQQPQPHLAQYTNWIYHATWHYALLWSHTASTTQLLRDTFVSAANVFRTIYRYKYLTNSSSNTAHWNASNRTCWTQEDGYDAMEVSVSGGGCRPTIAAVMYEKPRHWSMWQCSSYGTIMPTIRTGCIGRQSQSFPYGPLSPKR
jgi:hypothetical protein